MPGLIRREDVEAVRDQSRIEDIVGEHVTLRPAGVGSQKGLCPFHDERTPSFHVRPQVGRYHCFGCGEGGDVIAFLQAIDHLSFTEAVERLAARIGYQLRYEDGAGPDRGETGKRQRLLDANAAAEQFFREQLTTPAAAPGRTFLAERGFDRDAATQFGVGFAPQGWDAMLRHLRGRGFTDPELTGAGLVSAGNRGPYDRFRGRLVWPIHDITGATVGFGARKLLDDDQGPKYLNTPQTTVYNKSAVLYGIDLAKREIAKQRQVVVVEGYTDVMAMHLSGVPTAVATCGTAFGADHIRIVRRLLADDDAFHGQVVFTFDGDAAGQAAALKAFELDQRFVAQTYVAVAPSGQDPCDLRQAQGPDAVRALVTARQPLFEFAIRSALARFDLDHAEGRVAGLRAGAPVVARIRDQSLRPEYARLLAGWLGMDVDEVRSAVASAARRLQAQARPSQESSPHTRSSATSSGERRTEEPPPEEESIPPDESAPAPSLPRPDLRNPVVAAEARLVQALLQFPDRVPAGRLDGLDHDALSHPALAAVYRAICDLGGPAAAGGDWVGRVVDATPISLRPLVQEMAVAPLPLRASDDIGAFAGALAVDVQVNALGRQQKELHSRLQRADGAGEPDQVSAILAELSRLRTLEHTLRTRG